MKALVNPKSCVAERPSSADIVDSEISLKADRLAVGASEFQKLCESPANTFAKKKGNTH